MLGDRYQLIAPIASGGMAQVWSARDLHLNRDVAAKILHPHLLSDDGFVARFRREAVAAARLSHRSIVAVYDTIGGNGVEAIVMELIEGVTLRALLDDQGALSAGDVIEISRQIAEALAVAHGSGLVHRDIKPANIMIRDDRRVLVTDFGIAKAANDADLTNTGTLLGTAKYLSPEQVTGAPIDPRSDLYSLGVVMFECLTGTVPFKANTDAAIALARLREDPPAVSSLRPNVPAGLDALVTRLMAREIDSRFPSAHDLALALTQVDPAGPPVDPAVLAARARANESPPSAAQATPAPTGALDGNRLRPPDPPRTPVVMTGGATGQARPPDPPRTPVVMSGPIPEPALPASSAHPPTVVQPPPHRDDNTSPRYQGANGGRDPSIELLGVGTGPIPVDGAGPDPVFGSGPPPSGPGSTQPRPASDTSGANGADAGRGSGASSTTTERITGSRLVQVLGLVAVAVGLVVLGVVLSGFGGDSDEESTNPFVEGGPGLTIIEATSFDPLSADEVKLEREELVPLAFDGNPDTAWTTEPYRRRGLGGLKEGVGLMMTLEQSLPLNQIELDSRAEDWSAEIYVADSFTSNPADWGTPDAMVAAGSNRQLRDLGRAEGSMVLLWITDTGVSDAGRNQFVLSELIIR